MLGIGGLRALEALGLKPTVFHMNEGHSAFLAIERIRVLMAEQGLSFDEAVAAARGNNVFTTHTSVPAGIDTSIRHDARIFRDPTAPKAGIPLECFLGLGRAAGAIATSPFDGDLAMQTSAFRNAVSRLHGRSRRKCGTTCGPLAGVGSSDHCHHQRRAPDLLDQRRSGELYDQYLQPDWREG